LVINFQYLHRYGGAVQKEPSLRGRLLLYEEESGDIHIEVSAFFVLKGNSKLFVWKKQAQSLELIDHEGKLMLLVLGFNL